MGIDAVELPGGLLFSNLSSTVTDGSLTLGFGGLTTLRGTLSYGSLARLTDLSGLTQLRTITGNLAVFGNPGLSSIAGLGALTTLNGSLSITNNPALSTCTAVALRNRVRPIGSGSATISGKLGDGASCP